jgi:hypothetical protein
MTLRDQIAEIIERNEEHNIDKMGSCPSSVYSADEILALLDDCEQANYGSQLMASQS